MTQLSIIPTVCGLLAALSWGTADFFAAHASKKISPELAVLFVGIIGAAAYTLFYMVHPGVSSWAGGGLGYAAGAGLFMGLGLLVFYRGLDVGPVSIVSPIGAAYPLVTTLVVLLLFGGSLSVRQIVGICLVVLGILAASGIFNVKESERRLTSGVVYALLTFVLWGFTFALLGEAVLRLGWEKATLVDVWMELVVFSVALCFLRGRVKLTKASMRLIGDKFIISTALIQMFGLIILAYGLTKASSTAVITAISASYPALTMFLALKSFREKVEIVPLLGAFVTIVGVVVLSLS